MPACPPLGFNALTRGFSRVRTSIEAGYFGATSVGFNDVLCSNIAAIFSKVLLKMENGPDLSEHPVQVTARTMRRQETATAETKDLGDRRKRRQGPTTILVLTMLQSQLR